MRSKTSLTACLVLAASLSLASGCGTTAETFQTYPPAADLAVVPKPRLQPADLGSEAALDRHEINLEAWGEEGWLRVGRICRWAEARGAELPFQCPPSTATPPPDT